MLFVFLVASSTKFFTDVNVSCSFGVIMHEVFTREAPYHVFIEAIHGPYRSHLVDAVLGGLRPTVSEAFSTSPLNIAYATLMQRCWAEVPRTRPEFTEITTQLKSMHREILEAQNEHDVDHTQQHHPLDHPHRPVTPHSPSKDSSSSSKQQPNSSVGINFDSHDVEEFNVDDEVSDVKRPLLGQRMTSSTKRGYETY